MLSTDEENMVTRALTSEEVSEYSVLIAEPNLNRERLNELKHKIINYPPVEWERYYGSNHNLITSHSRFGGMVSFKKHFGKPLTDGLWHDLVRILGISGLWIIRHNESQWCISCPCIIRLDENELVKDIQLGKL